MPTLFLSLHRPASEQDVHELKQLADDAGAWATRLPAPWSHLLRIDGGPDDLASTLAEHSSVARTARLDDAAPLVSSALFPNRPSIAFGRRWRVGDGSFGVIAGPCSVESRSQLESAARSVAESGAIALRGGAWKPRTSPWDFQGLGAEGVAILNHVGRSLDLPVVTEVLDTANIDAMIDYVDVFQVGARNMQNYALLKALGEQPRPVLLKRGPGATVREWLLAAEYVVKGGNTNVVLCERGIRTFETDTRYTLDLAGALLAKDRSWLPVIIDPSHACGRPELIARLSAAALAAGLDGVIVEVHASPEDALSDGAQALLPEQFRDMMDQLRPLAAALGRTIPAAHKPFAEEAHTR